VTLDTTITPGQGGHITDHDEIATQIDALEAALATPGNLPIAIAGPALSALPPGTAGQVLTADPSQAGKARWATPAAASGVFFDITQYGAVAGGPGANVSVNKTACTNARAAILAAGSGTMWVPPGTFDVGDWECVLPNSATVFMHIAGDGVLLFSSDRGAGTYAIRPADPPVAGQYLCYSVINGVRIQGPGGSPVKGVSPAAMNGIKIYHGMVLQNGSTARFHAGISVEADHNDYYSWTSTENFYGVQFHGMGATGFSGDHSFFSCVVAGNTRASYAVTPTGVLYGTTIFHGHTGFGPYSFVLESGYTGGLTVGSLSMYGTSNEAIGNGFFYSEDGLHTASQIQMLNCPVTYDQTGTYKITAEPIRPFIKLGELSYFRSPGTAWNPLSVTVPALIDVDRLVGSCFIDNIDTTIVAATKFILARNAPQSVEIAGPGIKGVALPVNAAVTATAGTLIARYGGNSCGPNTANAVLLGVAANTVVGTATAGELCVVYSDHFQLNVQTNGSTAAASMMVPDPATPTKVTPVGANPVRPAVGVSVTGAVSAGLVTMNVHVQ